MSLLSSESIDRVRAGLASAEAGVRYRALDTLIRYGTPADAWAVDPLVTLLRGALARPDRESCRAVAGDAVAAVRALGFVGDTRAVRPLIAALGHWDAFLSGAAAWSLGEIGDGRAVGPLIAAFRERRDYAVAWALGALRARAAAGLLRAALAALPAAGTHDPDGLEMRIALIDALGRVGDRRALPMLRRLLAAPDDDVRIGTAVSLSRLGDESGRAELLAALDGASQVARLAAAERLSEQGDARGAAAAIAAYRRLAADRRIDFVISVSRQRPPRPAWVTETLAWIRQNDPTPSTLGWTLAEAAGRALAMPDRQEP
jgi:HEAT repeat protein